MSADENRKPTIQPAPDGPYVVKDLEALANRHGAVETKPTFALCRCGASANKPFCDGTHAKIDFSSAKLDGRVEDRRESYPGDGVTIHDNRGVCAHAGYCTDGLPAVFRLRQEPFVDAGGAGTEEILATVSKCPSGALAAEVAGGEPGAPEREPAIFIAPDGPYVVTGGPELADTAFGEGASTEQFTLCRCGGSKNKPFCDGAHWDNGFTDDDN